MRDRKCRESGDHVDAARARQDIHRASEGGGVETCDRVMQILPIAAQRRAETRAIQVAADLAFIDGVAGAGELAAKDFAHSLLQIREAVEAETIGEAHDGRGIDVEPRGHLIDGGERHRVRVRDDVLSGGAAPR